MALSTAFGKSVAHVVVKARGDVVVRRYRAVMSAASHVSHDVLCTRDDSLNRSKSLACNQLPNLPSLTTPTHRLRPDLQLFSPRGLKTEASPALPSERQQDRT